MYFNDDLLYLLTQSHKSTKMKKNLLGAIVIFLVTVAFLLMIDDISKSKNSQHVQNIDMYNVDQQPDLATTDTEE